MRRAQAINPIGGEVTIFLQQMADQETAVSQMVDGRFQIFSSPDDIRGKIRDRANPNPNPDPNPNHKDSLTLTLIGSR